MKVATMSLSTPIKCICMAETLLTANLTGLPLHREEWSGMVPLATRVIPFSRNPGEHEYANFVTAAWQQNASLTTTNSS